MVMAKILTTLPWLFQDFGHDHGYKMTMATNTPSIFPYGYGQTDVLTIEDLNFGHGHGHNF